MPNPIDPRRIEKRYARLMDGRALLRAHETATQQTVLKLAGLEHAATVGSVLLVDTGVGKLSMRGLPDVTGDRGSIEGHGSRMAMTLLLGSPALKVVSLRHRGHPSSTLRAAQEVAYQHDLVLCAWSSQRPFQGSWSATTPLLTVKRGASAPGGWPGVWAVPLGLPHPGSLMLPAQAAPFRGASLAIALIALRVLARSEPLTFSTWRSHLAALNTSPSQGQNP